MYNVHHKENGTVLITEVGDNQPLYTLTPDTLVTYKLPDDDTLLIQQVSAFASDAELLHAIARRVQL